MDFERKLRERAVLIEKDEAKATKISQGLLYLRLITFLALIASFYWLSIGAGAATILFLLSLAAFGFAIVKDNTNNKRKKLLSSRSTLTEQELRRTKGDLPADGTGANFLDENHNYAQDLDVFGPKSLFHHISRCVLPSSQAKLARYLTQSAPLEEVLDRQLAVQELQRHFSWRQDFQATLGQLSDSDLGAEKVLLQAASDGKTASPGKPIIITAWVLVTMATIVLGITNHIPVGYPVLICLINFALLGQYNFGLQKEAAKTSRLFRYLNVFSQSLLTLRDASFESALLTGYQKKLSAEAITELNKLRQIVFLLDSRFNQLWPLVNLIFLVDLYTGWLMNRWLARNQSKLQTWLSHLNHFEVLISFAGFADQNSDFQFPVFVSDPGTWEGTAVGHPLIPQGKRVSNDFSFEKPVGLITGSNMSGKSTFLRTIGVNTLMAWVGLPVCAKALRLSQFEIFTSMRTHDDLYAETSSFYAELKRIKKLFATIAHANNTVLFLLDEILKGTNSHDRHIGARGIVERLKTAPARGFVSTHDLTLADEYEDDELVVNYSFNSQLVGNDLSFDYRLSQAKCQSANASILMKKMGIIP